MLKTADSAALREFCSRDAFGTKILGYSLAYPSDISSAQFWAQENCGEITAAVALVYGTAVISASSSADFEELREFLKIIGFCTLSLDESVCVKLGFTPSRTGNIVRFDSLSKPLKGKACLPRYPDLRDVFDLLTRSGFDRLGEKNEWIADISRRMNRSVSQWSIIEQDGLPVACACALFVTDSAAFLGCVAADEKLRGKGLGSETVLTVADKYKGQGKRVELFCKDGSIVEFYKKSGFAPVGRWAEYDNE